MASNNLFLVHQRCTELAAKQLSKQDNLNALSDMLHLELTFYDVLHDRRVSTNKKFANFDSCSFSQINTPNRLWTFPITQATLVYTDSATLNTAIKIPSYDSNPYYLIVHCEPNATELTQESRIMIIETGVELLEQEILKKNAIDQNLFTVNNNIVHDLLLGRFSNHEKLENALESLNLNSFPHYQIFLVRITLNNSHSEKNMSTVRRAIRDCIRSLYPSVRFYVSNDRQLFIHNFSTTEDSFDLNQMDFALEKLTKDASIPKFSYLGVLSLTCNKYAIAQRNSEVMNTYKLFDESHWHNHCMCYENLGIYKLLMQIKNLDRINDYIDPRIMQLREENPDVLDTIICLCDNNLNFQETAKKMFLHPKTIHYRVKRAKELVNLDIRDSNDCLQIMLASRIFALANAPL